MFQSYVAVIEQGDYWRLLDPLVYEGNTDRWVVPAGFVTDFASIPWWARWALSPTGKHNRAAVLHDFLYRIAVGLIPSTTDPAQTTDGLPAWLSRIDADRIFLRVLRELDVPEWQARLMFWGVRLAWYFNLQGSSTDEQRTLP